MDYSYRNHPDYINATPAEKADYDRRAAEYEAQNGGTGGGQSAGATAGNAVKDAAVGYATNAAIDYATGTGAAAAAGGAGAGAAAGTVGSTAVAELGGGMYAYGGTVYAANGTAVGTYAGGSSAAGGIGAGALGTAAGILALLYGGYVTTERLEEARARKQGRNATWGELKDAGNPFRALGFKSKTLDKMHSIGFEAAKPIAPLMKAVWNRLSHVSTKKVQRVRQQMLAEQGIDTTGLDASTKSKDEYIKKTFGDREALAKALGEDYVGYDSKIGWVNNKFANDRKIANLRTQDIAGYMFETFGNDWLGKYSEAEREAILQSILKEGDALLEDRMGGIYVKDHDRARALGAEAIKTVSEEDKKKPATIHMPEGYVAEEGVPGYVDPAIAAGEKYKAEQAAIQAKLDAENKAIREQSEDEAYQASIRSMQVNNMSRMAGANSGAFDVASKWHDPYDTSSDTEEEKKKKKGLGYSVMDAFGG